MRKGLSNFLGVISDTFAPSPDKTIDCDVITLMATPSGTTELYDSAKVPPLPCLLSCLPGCLSGPVGWGKTPQADSFSLPFPSRLGYTASSLTQPPTATNQMVKGKLCWCEIVWGLGRAWE